MLLDVPPRPAAAAAAAAAGMNAWNLIVELKSCWW